MRIAACGQTSEHRPHWMQIFGSQIGISWAMLRFSYFVVAVGNVPSTGMALTGSWSPLPAMIMPGTRWTKSGASPRTAGSRVNLLVTWSGHLDLVQGGDRAVDGREVPLHDRLAARLAVGLLDRVLDLLDRLLARQARWPA